MVDWPYQHILYLRCPNPMTAHVDDIIKASGDLVIPLHRAIGAIPRKEVTCWHKDKFPEKLWIFSTFWCYVYFWPLRTRIRLTVGLSESLVVVMNGPGHTRPRLSYTQSSRYVVGSQLVSLKKAHNIMSYIHRYLQHICEVLYGMPHKTQWISKPSKCPACVFVCFCWEDERSAQKHQSNCSYNLCCGNGHKVVWQIFNMEFGTHKAWPTGEYQKWHSRWLFYNPNLAFSLRAVPSPLEFAWMAYPPTRTHTHLSVHEDGINAKERSHSHSGDNLCVWVWWPWTDADATCLWEYTAKQSRLKRWCYSTFSHYQQTNQTNQWVCSFYFNWIDNPKAVCVTHPWGHWFLLKTFVVLYFSNYLD